MRKRNKINKNLEYTEKTDKIYFWAFFGVQNLIFTPFLTLDGGNIQKGIDKKLYT